MKKQLLILITALMLVGTVSAGSTTPLDENGNEAGLIDKTSLWISGMSFDITNSDTISEEKAQAQSNLQAIESSGVEQKTGFFESLMRGFDITNQGETFGDDLDTVEPGQDLTFQTGFSKPSWEGGYCDTGVDIWLTNENGDVLDDTHLSSPCMASYSVSLDFTAPNSEGSYDYNVRYGDLEYRECGPTQFIACGDAYDNYLDDDSITVEETEDDTGGGGGSTPSQPEEITVYEMIGSGTDARCISNTYEEGNEPYDSYSSFSRCEADLPEIERANAQISGDSEGMIGERISFEGYRSTGEGSLSYTWRINGRTIGSGSSITHEFQEQGRQDVSLQIEDSEGQTDTASTTIYIDYQEPTATADTSQSTVQVGQSVQLDGSRSEGGSYNIQRYNWRVNGETFTGQRPTYTFEEEGTHTVELEVVDSENNRDTDSVQVTVEKDYELSNINMEAPRHVILDETQTLRFLEERANIEAGLQTVQWDIGETYSYTGTEIEHQFRTRGDHQVTMTVIDQEGQEVTAETVITVQEEEPGLIEKIVTWFADLFS